MSVVRKGKRGKNKTDTESEGPSKQDYEIAKYLRNKCPKKQTKLFDDKVYYFIGSRAVDTLLESPWSKKNKKTDQLFTTRNACIDYLNKLLELGLFARGEKIVVKKPEKKDKKKKEGNDTSEMEGKSSKTKDSMKEKEKEKSKGNLKKESKEDKSDDESEDEPESPKSDAKEAEKKKKKIRLELHHEHIFLDSNDAYIWIYEPTSIKNIAIGTIIVLGSIGACLFPLWPPIVRQGVYYLSLGMVGLIGLLIGASLFRYVVFGIVWVATVGNIYFWYLPNLTEDCGFFESFAPAYSWTRKGEEDDKNKKKKDKKKKKKGSDNEEDADNNQATTEQPADSNEAAAESPSTVTQRKKKKDARREDEESAGEGKVVPQDEEEAAPANLPEDASNNAEDKDNDNDDKLRSSNSSESDTFEIINVNAADD